MYISRPNFGIRGVAQPGLAHLPWEQGVAGSNPVAPTSLKDKIKDYHEVAAMRKIKDERQKKKDKRLGNLIFICELRTVNFSSFLLSASL